jgi:PBSX family phage portal protein
MVTNIISYGYRVVPRYPNVEMDASEVNELESFIEFANPEESLVAINEKLVSDFEVYGFGMHEVMRSKNGKIAAIRPLSAHSMFLLRKTDEDEWVEITNKVKRGKRFVTVRDRKRFRRYVQQIGSTRIYYKEFGDPRRMNYKTGAYETDEKPIDDEWLATEVLHRRQYDKDPYGTPRWISQMPNILGSREAEEVNLRYFEDNTVPPMIMSVSGGRLTRTSFQEIKELLNREGVGKERQNQIILIEALPETSGLDDKGNVQIKIDKLADVRPSDGLFKDYDEGNIAKVRSSFRLPPVVIGLSQDVTFATANVSAFVAETQVFLPERRGHDEFFNKMLVNHPRGLNLQTVRLESKGPAITNPEQVIKTMTALNVMGGLTPRKAIDLANEAMQLTIPQYPAENEEGWEEWMDRPISLALKNPRSDNTQDEQSLKDQDTKDVEGDGDVGQKEPENGQE